MKCFAAGWGKTKHADSTRGAHQTEITLISQKTCSTVYGKLVCWIRPSSISGNKYDQNEMVCTGGINRPCQGDGGAPLVSFKTENQSLSKNFRFARGWRANGFCMEFQFMVQVVVKETTMDRQFSFDLALSCNILAT